MPVNGMRNEGGAVVVVRCCCGRAGTARTPMYAKKCLTPGTNIFQIFFYSYLFVPSFMEEKLVDCKNVTTEL